MAVTPEQERDEVLAYMDELYDRLPDYARRAGAVPANSLGSVEWFKEIGKYWRGFREEVGLSRYELADRMGVHVNEVRFIETGVAKPEEVTGQLPRLWAEVLGRPELYNEFYGRFGVKDFSSPSKAPSLVNRLKTMITGFISRP